MKYAFLTDIHLDCLTHEKLNDFLVACADPSIDYYLISGDIAQAPSVESFLKVMVDAWDKPIIFCLGNHDFWYGSIQGVRNRIKTITEQWSTKLFSVTDSYFTALSDTTCVVGHNGWYDGLHGDARGSNFLMNDWWNIKEFTDVLEPYAVCYQRGGPRLDMISRMKVIELCQKLASKAASHVKKGINAAVAAGYQKVIVLTHVPPWNEAHVHEGKPGGDYAAPWFTSKIMGDMLEEVASKYAKLGILFEVLCGHTHGRVDVQISQNLTCRVGGADYIKPQIQFVLEV